MRRSHWRLALLTAFSVSVAFLARAHLPRMAGGPRVAGFWCCMAFDVVAIFLTRAVSASRSIALSCWAKSGDPVRVQAEQRAFRVVRALACRRDACRRYSVAALLCRPEFSANLLSWAWCRQKASTRLLLPAAASLIVIVGFLRMILLFPAVAVDAPEASWQSAFAETRGASCDLLGFACALPPSFRFFWRSASHVAPDNAGRHAVCDAHAVLSQCLCFRRSRYCAVVASRSLCKSARKRARRACRGTE